jgi:hypothetical protein
MPGHTLSNEIGLFESLSKLFAAALGVLYLTGFIVVASHLSGYGISSFSVVQLQYLIAGVWVLGPPALYASLLAVEYRFSERAAPEIKGKFNWRRFGISSLGGSIPSSVLMVLMAKIPNVSDNLTVGMGIRLFLFFFGMVIFAQLFWMSRGTDGTQEKWWLNRSHSAPFYLAMLLMIVFGYSLWFSARIYPLIPFSLGGGKPLTVVFFEGEKKMPDEIMKTASSAKRSIQYKLLLETDKYFVVASPADKERSLEISRDSIAGMVIVAAN